jgi:hypothetical protein
MWNLNFVLESGRPFTKPLFKAFYNGPGVTIYSDRNASRLPLYHRLDIGVQFNKKDPKGLNGALAYTYTMLMLTRIFMELF